MDDQATPRPDRVPDPHRDKPVPVPEEGMRPGVDPAVRPEQDEEIGPLEGLLSATSADVSEEASEVVGDTDPEGVALLEKMGVENEDIASGQLLGMVAAVLVAVVALAVILIYLFYIPYLDMVEVRADGSVEYEELDIVQTEGLAKLNAQGLTGDAEGIPIERAMSLVIAEYGSEAAAGLPESRQDWNMVPIMIGMGEAEQNVDRSDVEVRFDNPALVRDALADQDQEVGVETSAPPTVVGVDGAVIDTDDIE